MWEEEGERYADKDMGWCDTGVEEYRASEMSMSEMEGGWVVWEGEREREVSAILHAPQRGHCARRPSEDAHIKAVPRASLGHRLHWSLTVFYHPH